MTEPLSYDRPQPIASSSRISNPPPSHAHRVEHRITLDEDLSDDEEDEEDEEERLEFERRAQEYVQLHSSVQSSKALLDSLSTFLGTFQHDLSDVSAQIAELQGRSKEIDSRLESRKTLALPLNKLISDIILPPDLVILIRDTGPGDAWLPAIVQLEEKIDAVKAKGKVKAAHEMGMVVEGLRAKAISSLRTFLLSLLRPLRASVRTNIQVIQSSILLKFRPFFSFLSRQAPKVAAEIQRSYVTSARSYYETSFRRYCRALSVIQTRTTEKRDLLGSVTAAESAQAAHSAVDRKSAAGSSGEQYSRLQYSKLDGDGVVLAYMADDKDYKRPPEALFRSLMLVLMDNASAEFTFIIRFFSPDSGVGVSSPYLPQSTSDSPSRRRMSRANSIGSVTSFHAPGDSGNQVDRMEIVSEAGDEMEDVSRPVGRRGLSNGSAQPNLVNGISKGALADLEKVWKQVMDPAVDYCQTYLKAALNPLAPPPAIPLLTMIRLNDAILIELELRGCSPLENLCMGLKLSMWPIFQKEMDAHIESVRKLADSAGSSGFGTMLAKAVKDTTVKQVCIRYATFFSCILILNDDGEANMVASSLARLRSEVDRLIVQQSSKLKQAAQKNSYLSSTYEDVIKALSSGSGRQDHPQLVDEIAFFRKKETEARKRIRADK